MEVRTATSTDLPAVCNVLEGALLRIDVDETKRAIDEDAVLVTVSESGTVLGVVVLDGREITAIAVRRRRRGQGIGTALVEAAAERHDELVAEFDERVARFWRSLGFDIEPIPSSDRFRGRRVENGSGPREG